VIPIHFKAQVLLFFSVPFRFLFIQFIFRTNNLPVNFAADSISSIMEPAVEKEEQRSYEKDPKFQLLSASLTQLREQTQQFQKEVEKREKEILEREVKMKSWFSQQEEIRKKWAESCPETVELISSVYSL
jgi:uncharacterized coiled-coil DUF342 family protein